MSNNDNANDVTEAIQEWAEFAGTLAEKYAARRGARILETFFKFANPAVDFYDAYKALYKRDPVTAIAGIILAAGVVLAVGTELGLAATVLAAGAGLAETSPLLPLLGGLIEAALITTTKKGVQWDISTIFGSIPELSQDVQSLGSGFDLLAGRSALSATGYNLLSSKIDPTTGQIPWPRPLPSRFPHLAGKTAALFVPQRALFH